MPDWKPRNTERARALRNAATPAERHLWRYLSRSQLGGYKFSRQMQVGPFYPDFLCRRIKLVIELDGHCHDLSQDEDEQRARYLKANGYEVIRFSNADVLTNVEGVIAAIAQYLAGRPTPNPSRKREGS